MKRIASLSIVGAAALFASCDGAPSPAGPDRLSGPVAIFDVAPPDPNLIVFASGRDDASGDIYVMNPDGSGVRRLTSEPGEDGRPAWSPDHRKIAFQSKRAGGGIAEIFVMNADGSNVRRLTFGGAGLPVWSPDGRIGFAAVRDGNMAIFVVNEDGSGLVNLTDHAAVETWHSWSPNGQRIVFSSNRDGAFELYLMNADGSAVTRLSRTPGDDLDPEWSPDGRRIVFQDSPGDIYLINEDGTGLVRLLGGGGHGSPTWSPDGARIAFQSNRSGDNEVWLMNADGTGLSNLTRHPASDGKPHWTTASNLPVNRAPTAHPGGPYSGNEGNSVASPSVFLETATNVAISSSVWPA